MKFGEPFYARVVVSSVKETAGRLSLYRNGEFLGSQVIGLTVGKNARTYRQALERKASRRAAHGRSLARQPVSPASCAAAMPARAQASSLSETSPEMPTAPTTTPLGVANQDSARGWDHPSAGHRVECREERLLVRLLGHTAGQRPGADAHPKRPPGLAHGDLGTDDPRPILPGERLQVPTVVEDGHCQRRAARLPRLSERRLHDGRRLLQRDSRHVAPPSARLATPSTHVAVDEDGHLGLADLPGRYAEDRTLQLPHIGIQPVAVQAQKHQESHKTPALVAVDEQVVLHQVKQVRGGHLVQAAMEEPALERGGWHRES